MGNSKEFSAAVQRNIAHMGCSPTEWAALAITGMAETEGENGQAVTMPTFEFPAGYQPGPTLYRAEGAGQGCCEWCGTTIKNYYWIVNDTRRWTLGVGSECVKGFGGRSGEELAAEFTDTQKRQYILDAQVVMQDAYKALTFKDHRGYGRYDIRWRSNDARVAYTILKKLIGDVTPFDRFQDLGTGGRHLWAEQSPKALITRRMKAKDEIDAHLATLQAEVKRFAK